VAGNDSALLAVTPSAGGFNPYFIAAVLILLK